MLVCSTMLCDEGQSMGWAESVHTPILHFILLPLERLYILHVESAECEFNWVPINT